MIHKKCLKKDMFLWSLAILGAAMLTLLSPASGRTQEALSKDDPSPPAKTVKLIFIHHSCGQNWLDDANGRLGLALRRNNYFVSDTNYGWGPPDQDVGEGSIGDHTDIGHWYNWFVGPHRLEYLNALYAETGQYSSYSRLSKIPPGKNKIILFKSCFPNSNLGGNPKDAPTKGKNPLRGQDCGSSHMTVANAKGIYKDLLKYFATRQDKLFVVITAPPLTTDSTTPSQAANARAFNRWLVEEWLKKYRHKNVAVFDFFNVLTSNGGSADYNDSKSAKGNHHRWWQGACQYLQTVKKNTAAYPSCEGDSHPSIAGNRKATTEFVKMLNVYYHRWQDSLTASRLTEIPAASQ
ncbi:hypothetical protein [Desulforhabdus amnigena]|jgi:hypothetical protein|uniref:SGNH/GDSL hydrolase family protein n=1 Tax=Desulforhabdus amnigena TaxID=40218 RepID=A0A9W6D1P1_9BACT|nr:hypothetical protein [Desulforhabdus amnigena]NLJ29104.1 hypothetical protein [Deltaproteobacteria bacterium]GLI32575.1 hypothetical protein DAMNIGENAA_00080 [Desulforhabdus amnigena]